MDANYNKLGNFHQPDEIALIIFQVDQRQSASIFRGYLLNIRQIAVPIPTIVKCFVGE